MALAFSLVSAWPRETYATVPGVNQLISADIANTQAGNGMSENNHISANGRYVLFQSLASNIVSSDTNDKIDLFVRDVKANTTERVDVSSSGAEADLGISDGGTTPLSRSVISETGRYVVFSSLSTNLVSSSVPNGVAQLYMRDRQLGTTSLVGINANNDPAAVPAAKSTKPIGVSSDGRYVTFMTNALNTGPLYFPNNQTFQTTPYPATRLYVKDMNTGAVTFLSNRNVGTEAGDWTVEITGEVVYSAYASCDGSLIAFRSSNNNLVAGDTDSTADIFVVDLRQGKKVTSIGQSSNSGLELDSFSCNGNYIGISTQATNLIDPNSTVQPLSTYYHYYAYDLTTSSFVQVDQSPSGNFVSTCQSCTSSMKSMQISDDGLAIFTSRSNIIPGVVSNDTITRLYLRNIKDASTELLSLNNGGQNSTAIGALSITRDGRKAAYTTNANDSTSLTDSNGTLDAVMSLTGF